MFSEQTPYQDMASLQRLPTFVVFKKGRPKMPISSVPQQLNDLIVACWDPEPLKRPDVLEIKERMKPIELKLLEEEAKQKLNGEQGIFFL